jgi:hypothetical protein
MQWPIMRAINTIVSIGALSGIFLASSLTLFACQKKPTDQDAVTPGSEQDSGTGVVQAMQCGGFGGLQCPDGLTCVDDPADSCDPMQGGADCMGVCVEGDVTDDDDLNQQCNFAADPNKNYMGKSPGACATMKFTCDPGNEYFSDECGCGCVTSGMTDPDVTPPAK